MKNLSIGLILLVLLGVCGLNPQSASAQSNAASYYVRANGNDSNSGTNETAPFKTLAKAVETASKTNIKKITVIGKLIGQTEINNSGSAEILITGKTNASDAEKAVLTTLTSMTEGINTIQITGNSNIKLEYLTVNTGSFLAIIYAKGDEVKLTLGKNAVVFGNGEDVTRWPNGGGGILMVEGTLIMMDNAAVTNCKAGYGGGITIAGGKATIRDEASVTGNFKR